MFAATTSPSYSPTWVSGQMPVTSPIAQSRSPARRYSSTRMPWGSASTPTVSRPIPSTRGRRPVATSSRSPRSVRAAVELQDDTRHRPAARRWRASRASARFRPGAGPRRAPRPAARARGEARGRRPRRAPPRRRDAARSALSRRLRTRHPARAGGAGQPSCWSPRGCPRRPRAHCSPGIGGTIGSEPVATTTCSAVCRTPSTSTDAGARPAGPCRAAGRCRGRPATAPGRRRSSWTP